ncbi:MAG TPA: polymer-forming cytoskeletal protein [Cyclobacteriaceae bacterium]|nr:polymer-forming cytoskeletal protein [Cyclobacteriaceae bacterium]
MPDINEDKRSTTDFVTSSNLVALETVIVGDIATEGNIRIEGKVDGSLISQNKIVIGESAHVTGNIEAAEAEVSGHIDGGIRCRGTLHLKKTAYINGDIAATKLIIENGAVFNGKCSMSGEHQTIQPNFKENGGHEGKGLSR